MATKLLDATGKTIRCSEHIWRGWSRQCTNDATVLRDCDRWGECDSPKAYCTIHDPERRRARREKRDAEQRAKIDRTLRSRDVIKAGLLKRILAGVETEQDAEKLFDDVSGYGYRIARGY
jgi:hypothetical protein